MFVFKSLKCENEQRYIIGGKNRIIHYMQKKICFFNTTKVWGGGEKWHFDVSKYLTEKGYDIFLVCRKNSELHKKLQNAGIRHYPLNIGNLSYLNPQKIVFLKKLFEKEGVRTIIMNLSSDVKLAAHAAKRAGVKKIIYRRGSAIPLKNTFYNRYIFKNWVTEILANSEATKKTINQNNPNLFPENKITVIYNGINLDAFADCEKQTGNKKIILGNVGRLEREKGHKELIEIGHKLFQQGLDFELRIAGAGSQKKELEEQIDKRNLKDHVFLKGFKNDVKEFLKPIDIFLLTSHWEGFGYVLVESMACYKPVIAFGVSSIPEIVEDDKTGYVIPMNDLTLFAKKIQILAENEDLRIMFGYNGRKRTERYFDIKKSFERIEKYLTI